MESRKGHTSQTTSSLPEDYLKLVQEVFTTNFDTGLKQLSKIKPNPNFEASGSVFTDEIVLCVSLSYAGMLAATSVYASCDFDPQASAPTIQDLLGYCVDAIGSAYASLLTQEALNTIDDAQAQWTVVEIDRHKIFLKVDKSNPKLDQMTEEWLSKHDPEQLKQTEEKENATKELFITGPKLKPDKD